MKKSLSEKKPEDVDLFTKNVQAFIKDVLANFKEYQLFCGIVGVEFYNHYFTVYTVHFMLISMTAWISFHGNAHLGHHCYVITLLLIYYCCYCSFKEQNGTVTVTPVRLRVH